MMCGFTRWCACADHDIPPVIVRLLIELACKINCHPEFNNYSSPTKKKQKILVNTKFHVSEMFSECLTMLCRVQMYISALSFYASGSVRVVSE